MEQQQARSRRAQVRAISSIKREYETKLQQQRIMLSRDMEQV
jgi:hypothetical protein